MAYFEENGFLDCLLDDDFEKTYSVDRYSGTTLVDGRREKIVDGAFKGSILAHIEEASPRKLERLSDAENELAKISIITKDELRIVDGNRPADVVIFLGRRFEVKEGTTANAGGSHSRGLAILVAR